MRTALSRLKQIAQEGPTWLDGLMAGRQFVCGDRLTLADILMFCTVDFVIRAGQPINQDNKNIVAWHGRMKTRPSAEA